MPDVLSDGLQIHYEVEGTGTPVVLLHGMNGSGAMWTLTGWIPVLRDAGYQTIAIDGRGRGKSSPVSEPGLFRNGPCVRDIAVTLDALGLEKAHLIGYSMGSGQALRMALEAPSRVRSIVLGGTGGGALAFAGLYYRSAMHSRQMLCGWRDMLIGQLLGIFGGREEDRTYIEAYSEALQQDALERGDLENLSLPVLIVLGEHDDVQGEFAATLTTEMLARRIPAARRLVLAGADHGTCVPDQRFKDAVLSFFAEQED